MILYTCGQRDKHAGLGHPCGRAARRSTSRLRVRDPRAAGATASCHGPGATGANRREEVKALTGQTNLPVLALDEGETVVWTGDIIEWAKAHPLYQARSAADEPHPGGPEAARLRQGPGDLRGRDELIMVASDRISVYDVIPSAEDS